MATKPDTAVVDDTSWWAHLVLLLATLFVGTVSFAMSFHGLYDLLVHVAKVPVTLAVMGPMGVDGLTLCAVAATHLLRQAPWRVRVYAWTVFAVPTVLSIAGQIVDARVRHLRAEGLVALAVMPPLFALSAHLTVVTLRWAARLAHVVEMTDAGGTEDATEPDSEDQPDGPKPRRPMTQAQAQAVARRRRANGATYEQIATGLTDKGYRVSAKTVERWLRPAQSEEPELAPVDAREPEVEGASA